MHQLVKPVFLKRLVVYCLGLFIMALGVSFSVKSNLGVSPVNSIPKVLCEIFPQCSMGTWTTIVFCCFILIQLFILGRYFHPSRFLQILCSFLFGRFVDLSNWLTSLILPIPHLYAVRLIYLVISMALVGLGILFYLEPKILPLPGEGVMLAISEKFNIALYKCKIGFDATVVVVAVVTSLTYFHYFNGVREGTIIAAFGVGKFLGFFTSLLKPRLAQFLDMPTITNADVPQQTKIKRKHITLRRKPLIPETLTIENQNY